MDSNVIFCRLLLATIRDELTSAQRKLLVGSWSYMYDDGHGEFHTKDGFYWYGSADNAYDARYQGISAWLEEKYPETQEVVS